MVVDYDGRILAQTDAGPGENVVVAPIDISSLRRERGRRMGHDMPAHLRTEMYPYLEEQCLPPADAHPLATETIRARIKQGKRIKANTGLSIAKIRRSRTAGFGCQFSDVQQVIPGFSSRISCFDPVASRYLGILGAMKSAIGWEMPYSNSPTF